MDDTWKFGLKREPDLSTFGNRLRHTRLEMGLSVREIAPMFGMSHVEFGRIERGCVEAGGDFFEQAIDLLNVHRPTEVVHVKSGKHTVYIGRAGYGKEASIWANPIKLKGKSRAARMECLLAFTDYLDGRDDLIARTGELRGKVLGCYCAPLMCHGHVLARMSESECPQDTLENIRTKLWRELDDGGAP